MYGSYSDFLIILKNVLYSNYYCSSHQIQALHSIGMFLCVCQSLSRVRLSATPWTVAHQAPLSMAFSRQEDWSGLPCSSPGDLPNPGIKPASLMSAVLADKSFLYHGLHLGSPQSKTLEPFWKHWLGASPRSGGQRSGLWTFNAAGVSSNLGRESSTCCLV